MMGVTSMRPLLLMVVVGALLAGCQDTRDARDGAAPSGLDAGSFGGAQALETGASLLAAPVDRG